MNSSSIPLGAVNAAWCLSQWPSALRLESYLGRPCEVQTRYLARILRSNGGTRYGQRYGFPGLMSVAQFQAAVPVTAYEDYQPSIDAIAAGEDRVLTDEPVLLFQPSSGAASASKLIPYTEGLRRDFLRGIEPWLHSLYRRYPRLRGGRSYWSISPPATLARHKGLIRVGFAQDADYLGRIGRWAFPRISAVPATVACHDDPDIFRINTLACLVATQNLALISVWSPAFLTVLLDYLCQHGERVLASLSERGTEEARAAAGRFERYRIVQGNPGAFRVLWPRLEVISCWTHGPSEQPAAELGRQFPGVRIEPKGLIATEAFVSLPLSDTADPVLAIGSHFFEFVDASDGSLRLAHEVERGRVYTMVVTTRGGLYRYRLGDQVEITGFMKATPTLRFVAREGRGSDMFGEKLNAAHVQRCLAALLRTSGAAVRFAMLAPAFDTVRGWAYVLFVEPEARNAHLPTGLARDLDSRLGENFHYQHCRRMQQLSGVRIFVIDGARCSPEIVFQDEMHRRGQRAGDIKPAVIDAQDGWQHRFVGEFLNEI